MSKSIYNKVILGKDELIYVSLASNQSCEMVKTLGRELKEVAAEMRKRAKPVLVYTDAAQVKETSLLARKEGIKVMRETDCDRGAIIGSTQLFNQLMNFIIIASGVGFKVKYFTNEKDAKEWLVG